MNLIGLNSTTNTLSSIGGIVLAGNIFSSIGFTTATTDIPDHVRRSLLSLAGLQIQGRTRFAEIEQFRKDVLFKEALELPKVYSPETIRLYVEQGAKISNNQVHEYLDKMHMNLLKKATFTPICCRYGTYIPVDIDVSPMDNHNSHKEGVSRTYKGHDGFAPIFSYIGVEGYMLDQELRPGKQHSQKGAPQYILRTLDKLKQLSLPHPVLYRLDSGHDAYETIRVLSQSNHFFLYKKNLRRESLQRWRDIATSIGSCYVPREGKQVFTGVLTAEHPKAKEQDKLPSFDQVFRVTIRTSDDNGNNYLFPDVEVEVFWTNLYEDPETIINLYHDHATSEQFHSELKTDMNVERLPSGKFSVNEIILHTSMIAFNTLRLIGQTALQNPELLPYRHKGKRKRLRKVIDDLIRISCKVVNHARTLVIKIWEKDPWYNLFKKLYLQL